MIDETAAMGQEYDDLLLKQDKTLEDWDRIQCIENMIAAKFGYDWMLQYLEADGAFAHPVGSEQ